MPFERCIFEILGKLAVSELTALCNFIDAKIDILDRELNKHLAFTNILQDEFIQVEAKIRAGEQMFQDVLQTSTLLTVAQNLSPNCPEINKVFGGVLEAAETAKSAVNDAVYVARQILTVNGLIQTVKNEIANIISALKDLCRIVQLIILENTGDFSQFTSGQVQPFTEFMPKG